MTIVASDPSSPPRPIIRRRPDHPIRSREIDPDAMKIIFRLHGMGFAAYVVGGAVRDLLLGRKPKDFDIATDARPGQIKKRFGNAYVIGRRFRLVHVRFQGNKVIEVATFRRITDAVEVGETQAEIVQVDSYGTPAEDAFRRDITINALFYDPIADTVIDYVGGLEDMARRTVRCIGDPHVRFKEDPVRIWRVLRHAARLDFELEDGVRRAIPVCLPLLGHGSGSRLYEELNKDLALSPGPVFRRLREFGVLGTLLGRSGRVYERDDALFGKLVSLLEAMDRSRASGAGWDTAELYTILFEPLAEGFLLSPPPEIHSAIVDLMLSPGTAITVPRKLRADVSQIMFILGNMLRALPSGRMRWSLRERAHYAPAGRVCWLLVKGRPPADGESFESLFRERHGGGGAPHRRRRKPRRARPSE
jgi:poly(A) polymerase